ncbi:MAG: hypothetical protein N3E50_10375 [Candidatus Goldbacteria bacterium]|nr:hypothetical protein [Candidatus Goldiibacteriota bacterium]
MRKSVIISLIFLILIANIEAEQKNLTKLVGGTALACVGALLTYWGFSFKSTSFPEITMQSFTWTKNFNTSWEENYTGTIKNTGNTDITNVKLSITFKDINGYPISTQIINGPSVIKTDSIYSFSNSYNTGSNEPGFVSVTYSGNFVELYETRDLFIGIAGIATAACGLFFIADYFFDFTTTLKEKNIAIKLLPEYSGIKLIALKNF